MAEGTDLEKANAFFSCGSEGKSEQDILYYLGVLIKNVAVGDITIEADLDQIHTDLASILLLSAPASTITDRSAAITTGGTAQQVAPAVASRRWFFFENISDEDMWINFGVAAVSDKPSIKVVAGGSYENPPHFCPRGTISVISATTGKKFTSKEAA